MNDTTPTWYRKTDPDRTQKWQTIMEKVRTEPAFAHCRHYAGASRPDFAAWLAFVDRHLGWGLTFNDLPDAPLRDWWEHMTPREAAALLTGEVEA